MSNISDRINAVKRAYLEEFGVPPTQDVLKEMLERHFTEAVSKFYGKYIASLNAKETLAALALCEKNGTNEAKVVEAPSPIAGAKEDKREKRKMGRNKVVSITAPSDKQSA